MKLPAQASALHIPILMNNHYKFRCTYAMTHQLIKTTANIFKFDLRHMAEVKLHGGWASPFSNKVV